MSCLLPAEACKFIRFALFMFLKCFDDCIYAFTVLLLQAQATGLFGKIASRKRPLFRAGPQESHWWVCNCCGARYGT